MMPVVQVEVVAIWSAWPDSHGLLFVVELGSTVLLELIERRQLKYRGLFVFTDTDVVLLTLKGLCLEKVRR